MKQQLAEFVKLDKKRRELESKLDCIKTAMNDLQEPLQDAFADLGIQNVNIDGLTVFVRTVPYVSKRAGTPTEAVCNALRDTGLGYMVSEGYSSASLKSKVKEFIEQDGSVPDTLAKLLNIGENTILSTRRA